MVQACWEPLFIQGRRLIWLGIVRNNRLNLIICLYPADYKDKSIHSVFSHLYTMTSNEMPFSLLSFH